MKDEREIVEVSENELTGILLASIQSAKPIGIISVTTPNCFYKGKNGSRKKDSEQCPTVVKRQRVSAMTNFAYINARNNDNARAWARQVATLRKEGQDVTADVMEEIGPEQHELQPRKWGERIQGTPFIRHHKDGQDYLYIELMISTGNNPAWPSGYREKEYIHPTDESVRYTLSEETEEGEISLAPWLKPYTRPDTAPNDFDYREVRLDHIREVRTGGKVYVVRRSTLLTEAA